MVQSYANGANRFGWSVGNWGEALSVRPALIICDEAGFGVPLDPNEPRLWVSAVCVPEVDLPYLDGLNLAKGRRLNRTDRDQVVALFRSRRG